MTRALAIAAALMLSACAPTIHFAPSLTLFGATVQTDVREQPADRPHAQTVSALSCR